MTQWVHVSNAAWSNIKEHLRWDGKRRRHPNWNANITEMTHVFVMDVVRKLPLLPVTIEQEPSWVRSLRNFDYFVFQNVRWVIILTRSSNPEIQKMLCIEPIICAVPSISWIKIHGPRNDHG